MNTIWATVIGVVLIVGVRKAAAVSKGGDVSGPIRERVGPVGIVRPVIPYVQPRGRIAKRRDGKTEQRSHRGGEHAQVFLRLRVMGLPKISESRGEYKDFKLFLPTKGLRAML